MKLRVVLLSVVAACGAKQPAAVDAPTVVDTPPQPQPALSISLTPTTVAAGETVTLAVTTTHHDLVDPRPGPAPQAGEGHFHYYRDADTQYTAAWEPTVALRTTAADAPGAHTVRVVLVTSAHVEVVPLVEASATFTIE